VARPLLVDSGPQKLCGHEPLQHLRTTQVAHRPGLRDGSRHASNLQTSHPGQPSTSLLRPAGHRTKVPTRAARIDAGRAWLQRPAIVFSSNELLTTLVAYIPVQLSLSVHEWAHARVAYALGDDTAARQGRMTLNPLVHIDLLGTIIPLLGVPFGWAKPVPVNPARFRRNVSMRTGMMLTAAAGPLSNVALALLCFVALASLIRMSPESLYNTNGVLQLLAHAIIVNLSLAAFNLLPIMPLDGSRIVDGIIPQPWRHNWERLGQLSPMLLMLVIFVAPRAGFDVFGWVRSVSDWMFQIVQG
jgi:Zn-dependent protease